MINEIQKQLYKYEIKILSNQNIEYFFEIYNSNQYFFLNTYGEKVTISNIMDINAIPPNLVIKKRSHISLCDNGNAIGILDLFEEHPEKSSIWIGLLLIHSDLHGNKIGSEVVKAITNAAKILGYKSIQLGVTENNTRALSFWQKQGFKVFRPNGNVLNMVKRIV